jgi:hypothetical protein
MPMLAEAWRSYERNVLPSDAAKDRRRETRLACYAGAQALLNLVCHIGSEDARDELAVELGESAAEMRREAERRDGRRATG